MQPLRRLQLHVYAINEDGTSEETINHIGRHELFDYFDRSMSDAGLAEFYGTAVNRANKNMVENLLQMREDPTQPNTLDLWVTGDNLRKGAALNAVQLAELLLS